MQQITQEFRLARGGVLSYRRPLASLISKTLIWSQCQDGKGEIKGVMV